MNLSDLSIIRCAGVTALIILFAGCKPAGNPILLRLRLQPKEEFNIEVECRFDPASGNYYGSNYTAGFFFRVDSASAIRKDYLLSCQLKYALMHMRMPYESSFYDSRRREKKSNYNLEDHSYQGKDMERVFTGIIDYSVDLRVSNRGEVKKPASLTTGGIITLSGIPISYSLFQIVFPEKLVTLMEEWTNEDYIKEASFRTTSHYRIISVQDNIVHINVTATMSGISGLRLGVPFSGEYGISQQNGKLRWMNLQFKASVDGQVDGVMTISALPH